MKPRIIIHVLLLALNWSVLGQINPLGSSGQLVPTNQVAQTNQSGQLKQLEQSQYFQGIPVGKLPYQSPARSAPELGGGDKDSYTFVRKQRGGIQGLFILTGEQQKHARAIVVAAFENAAALERDRTKPQTGKYATIKALRLQTVGQIQALVGTTRQVQWIFTNSVIESKSGEPDAGQH